MYVAKALFSFLSVGLHTLVGFEPACRHEPSCSRYASEAVEVHGWYRGAKLFFGRLWRCRPGGTFGWDPVPSQRANLK